MHNINFNLQEISRTSISQDKAYETLSTQT